MSLYADIYEAIVKAERGVKEKGTIGSGSKIGDYYVTMSNNTHGFELNYEGECIIRHKFDSYEMSLYVREADKRAVKDIECISAYLYFMAERTPMSLLYGPNRAMHTVPMRIYIDAMTKRPVVQCTDGSEVPMVFDQVWHTWRYIFRNLPYTPYALERDPKSMVMVSPVSSPVAKEAQAARETAVGKRAYDALRAMA